MGDILAAGREMQGGSAIRYLYYLLAMAILANTCSEMAVLTS
jgi:hypothetical protein